MEFPEHIALSISHNECATVYETVAETIADGGDYFGVEKWVSTEQMELAIRDNEIWTAHWYPKTPVGFCVMHAADLETLLKAINDNT